MEVIQRKLKKFSGVVCVFMKIGYVAGIVALCMLACALAWTIAAGGPNESVKLFGATLKSPVDAGDKNMAEALGFLSYAFVYCAFLIAVMRMMTRLFANMRDHYTPFTMENARLFKRVAIWMIVAAIVPATVGQAVGAGCAKLLSLPFQAEYGSGFSLIAVLLFFCMSIVFQYGCALQDESDTTL